MRRALPVLPLLFAASPAWAEVGDKVASSISFWIWALCFNLAAWALARKAPLLALAVLPPALLWSWLATGTLYEPDLGPAILAELGRGYFAGVWTAAALSLAGPVLIALACRFRERRQG